MPDATTPHHLESAIATSADPDTLVERIWAAWDDIGSPAVRRLLTQVRERRQAIAAERRRLEEEFARTVPAAEGVEAPEERYEPVRDEDGGWQDGW